MAVTIDGMDDIIKEFLVESAEGIDVLERDLVALERGPEAGNLLAEIFRAVHTLKGNCGALGYPKLESVTHAGETVLAGLRDGRLVMTPELTNGLLAMVDALRGWLRMIEENGNEGDCDCTATVVSLRAMAENLPADHEQEVQETNRTALEVDACSNFGGGGGEVKVHTDRRLLNSETSVPLSRDQLDTAVAPAGNIRVKVGDLDYMMNLVGELITARNQVLHFAAKSPDARLGPAAQPLKSISTALQDAVMKARMQPIGTVWNGFRRLVRDMAARCGKQVVIEMRGSAIELDRTILEAIKGPLTHILRNAIDHGIEHPDQRIRAGKSATGRLSLNAFHKGGRVYLEISDDGAGIDVPRVRQRALESGLITAEQSSSMNEREIARLVFTAGFSTAKSVTKISGCGVGLDVVRTNIEKIGGAVDLQSVRGEGTTLKINLPLTLAVLGVLIVGSGGERFAIPQVNLVEVAGVQVEQKPNPIEQVHGAWVYRRRGQLLPLVFLDRLLGLPQQGIGSVHVLVLLAGARQFGLVVDNLGSSEEIVIKPLGKLLQGLSGYAGATILGDGGVVLVLDVADLAQLAKLSTSPASQPRKSAAEVKPSSIPATQSWVTFRGAEGRRFALPMSAVERLEELPAQRVERTQGGEIVQRGGQIVPLLRISALFHESSRERNPLPVIVLRDKNRSVGLVVDQIEDLVEAATQVAGGRQTGWLRGTAVIHDRVADLLDVERVLALANENSSMQGIACEVRG